MKYEAEFQDNLVLKEEIKKKSQKKTKLNQSELVGQTHDSSRETESFL